MRQITNINENWKFIKSDVGAHDAVGANGENVNVPHTWNNVDGQDGGNDYFRGKCWYVKNFKKPEFESDERIYLEFRGVNASAEVYLNDTLAITHDGGYSTFRKDITDLLCEDNVLCVSADNSVNDRVYPQKADFTFYGGIYRDVYLVKVNEKHFEMNHFGTPGLKITPSVNGNDADIEIEFWHNAENAEVNIDISDAAGNKITSVSSSSPENNGGNFTGKETLKIENVHLWDGVKDPYLYTAKLTLKADGKETDEISSRFGVRTFSIDPEKGFFLNGRSYPLHGVSRHQDRKGLGNAISKAEHKEDMDLIKEVGANTIRLAHYQHDQYFYDLCDEYGMIVWAEIPYISQHMPNGRDNTISQMKELIVQNYNHPSIVTWGLSNEITMFNKTKKDMLDNHHVLNDLCHNMDKTRPTTLACFAMCGPFNRSAHISDIVSWNLYLGWYVPGLFLNDWWISMFHLFYPKRALGYSEYGCEGMPNLHSEKPHRGDHTEEYQAKYHEFMLECFKRHTYLWSTHVWNMFDFAADARNQGGEPGMNHKGLVTFDRKTKKDSFYVYKAYWSDEPFIHLCSKRFVNRTGDTLKVKVYTNQKSVTLYVNGKKIEEKTGDKVFEFSVPMQAKNEIEVRSGSLSDKGTVISVKEKDPSYSVKKAANKSWEK